MIKTIIVTIILITTVVTAQEVINRTVPVTTPTDNSCQLNRLIIEPPLTLPIARPARIYIELIGTSGVIASKVYDNTTTPTAATLLTNLNKANHSGGNPSLVASIFNRLITDNVCAGTVTGVPQ